MPVKILTVDDSKTVRIIVKKAFKSFDCDILEAANGVEGLASAAKETPDLILLDITMPVMDGVEMLTKLKSDPAVKGIPVIMLTAEAGKENVLKIAKIGVRDYIVKPFKEEVLIEKVGRIIDLRPAGELESKRKSIEDNLELLVVEDKPAIIKLIQDGLAQQVSWKVHGVASTGEAIDFCQKNSPDGIIISLSLPDESALTLFRLLRSSPKTKYTPVFGLSVKTAVAEQQEAQQNGFTSILTKPIEINEIITKMARAANLDTSTRYYELSAEYLLVRVPESYNQSTINEISGYLAGKITDAVDSGISRVIFDVHALKNLNMDVIKFLLQAMQSCKELGISYSLVGNADLISEAKGFEESKEWIFHDSVENAHKQFVQAA